jgi:hypothetical protein
MSSVVLGLAAITAVVAAALVAMKFTGLGWRTLPADLVRMVRSDSEHPNWEVLMQ